MRRAARVENPIARAADQNRFGPDPKNIIIFQHLINKPGIVSAGLFAHELIRQ